MTRISIIILYNSCRQIIFIVDILNDKKFLYYNISDLYFLIFGLLQELFPVYLLKFSITISLIHIKNRIINIIIAHFRALFCTVLEGLIKIAIIIIIRIHKNTTPE
jgi:hypothetical protein